ncbi:MAG: amidohydrolase [Candidatus Saccharicenans subterraneus]|uniref:Amidohydrolase n=1 Tax=Candidatus Saccharicenans subterraneus TaxID=2508984 RepID=A0A3E2BNP4_9BACT|nr:MAG: amidohydrolase [Candidatus Saccharicenans subterraneum]
MSKSGEKFFRLWFLNWLPGGGKASGNWPLLSFRIVLSVGLISLFFVTGLAESQSGELIAITGARILTAAGQSYERGTILIKDGKILDIGAEVKIPAGARVVNASGCLITPGLVDAHSHLGLGPSGGVTEDNEMTDPVTPQLRIIDSIHPEGVGPDKNQFLHAVAEGVTAALVHPGSGNVIGGQSAVLKLRGRTVDEMCIKFPACMKMALGRKVFYASKGQMPMTKMGTAFLVRQAMLEAAEHRKALENYERERKKNPAASAPPRDLKKEALLLVLDKKIPVHIHVGSADDIMTAVRLAEEFGFKELSLAHAEEAYKVAEELARHRVKVVVGPRMITYDDQNRLVNLADYLHRRGIEVSIMTDADVIQQPFLRTQAAIAVKYGMDPDAALRAITINPARLAGVAERLGSLEKGKDADLVVWSGDLFDIRQPALRVFIDGREVFRAPGLSEE